MGSYLLGHSCDRREPSQTGDGACRRTATAADTDIGSFGHALASGSIMHRKSKDDRVRRATPTPCSARSENDFASSLLS
jgi:hypothetical protein